MKPWIVALCVLLLGVIVVLIFPSVKDSNHHLHGVRVKKGGLDSKTFDRDDATRAEHLDPLDALAFLKEFEEKEESVLLLSSLGDAFDRAHMPDMAAEYHQRAIRVLDSTVQRGQVASEVFAADLIDI
jgi:hypothetical protein